MLAEKHRERLGEVLTISEAVDLIKEHSRPIRAPGEVMEYSNTNYVLLAGVIERVSGKTFEDYMHTELFQPLQMQDTRVWTLQSTNRSANQAKDFDQVDEERLPVTPSWLDGVAGDGGVYCSLNDFVIWDKFWNGNKLVSDQLLQQSFARPTLNDGAYSNYGFGWVLEGGHHWHNGAWLGANSYIVRYPKSSICLVVLDNSSNIRFDTIVNELEAALAPLTRVK